MAGCVYGARGFEFLRAVKVVTGEIVFDCLVCFGVFDWKHVFAHSCVLVLQSGFLAAATE